MSVHPHKYPGPHPETQSQPGPSGAGGSCGCRGGAGGGLGGSRTWEMEGGGPCVSRGCKPLCVLCRPIPCHF